MWMNVIIYFTIKHPSINNNYIQSLAPPNSINICGPITSIVLEKAKWGFYALFGLLLGLGGLHKVKDIVVCKI